MNELEDIEYVFTTISRQLSLADTDDDFSVAFSEKIWEVSNWDGSVNVYSENITDLFPVIEIRPDIKLHIAISFRHEAILDLYNKEYDNPIVYENKNALEFFKYNFKVVDDE